MMLALLTSGASISLGNNYTAVTLTDGDGMFIIIILYSMETISFPSSAASFALSTTATVTEGASLMMCAQMESAGATLGKEVIVTLSSIDGTGKDHAHILHSALHMTYPFIVGTAGDDYSPLSSVSLTFSAGSIDGVEKCITVNAASDDLVECDEEFKVVLALSTPGISLALGNNITAVKLIDGDGMLLGLVN